MLDFKKWGMYKVCTTLTEETKMEKYKVYYVGYDTIGFGSIRGSKVVLANSKEHAKDIIESQSEMGGYEYFVEKVELVGE